MATPREEVLLSQAQSNGLKPDRTTSQPDAGAAPARTLPRGPAAGTPRMTTAQINQGIQGFNSRQLATANSAPGNPALEAAYERQRAVEAADKPRRSLPTDVQRSLAPVPVVAAAAAPAKNGRGPGYVKPTPTRPIDPVNMPPPYVPRALPQAAPAPATAADLGPAYEVAGYNGPVVGQPRAANIAGGLDRAELIRRLEMVGGDRNARLSPTLMRAMTEPYVAMLADKDKAELQREKGGMDLQQTAVQGQAQGALELQRGLTRRGETVFNQAGAEKLEGMRQDAPAEITDAAGNVFLRRGLKAEQVMGPDGKPIKKPAPGEAGKTRAELLADLSKNELDNQQFNPEAPTPATDALRKELGIDSGAAGGQAPNKEAWIAKAKEKFPNATAEELETWYTNSKNGKAVN